MERKVKYDYTFKLECVKLVLEKYHSCSYVSAEKGIERSSLRKWIIFYQKYGAIGLLPRRNQSYSLDFKLEVLKAIAKEALSLRFASVKFNIFDTSIIVKCKRDFANFGYQ